MLDDELRALLSTEPSADFTARVRAAVRNDTARTSWAVQGWLALAAAAVFAFWISGVTERSNVANAPAIAATVVGGPAVALRGAVHDVRPIELPTPTRPSSPRPASIVRPEIQLDPVELRTLQTLFANPPAVPVELPDTTNDAIVIPAITVAPLHFESLSQGSSQ
jgi:hypothetical protein